MKKFFASDTGKLIRQLFLFGLFLPLILEGATRLLIPQQLIIYDDFYATDEEIGIGLKPAANIDIIVNTGERDVRLTTDHEGHRIGKNTPQNPEIKILALGDSFIEAIQVEYEDTLTARLEQSITSSLGRSARVFNTGNAIADPNHYKIQLEHSLTHGEYDLVLVLVNASNDIVSYQVDYYVPKVRDQIVYLRWPQSFEQKEILNATVRPINEWLERNSHLFVLLKSRFSVFLAQIGLTGHSFPPQLLTSNASSPDWDTTARILADMQMIATEQSTPILFAQIPVHYQLSPENLIWAQEAFDITPEQIDLHQPYTELQRAADQYEVAIINLQTPLQEAMIEGETDLYGQIDPHLSPRGHKVIADFLRPEIESILGQP